MRLLTKSGGILGPIATVLGYVMSGIFAVLVAMNIPNIGLSIVLFTIVIYMVMLPLTYRQQKFSRMTPLMNPELTAIREKYKGKNDQATMQRMNEETKQVYAKYGVNPAGSCVQLVVQMLILFPLYRVIMNVPAYVSQVRAVFEELASKLLTTPGAEKYLQEIGPSIQATTISKEFTANTIIDTLYKFRPDNWTALAQKFPDLGDIISSTEKVIGRMNNFLGLNIADSPFNIMKSAFFPGDEHREYAHELYQGACYCMARDRRDFSPGSCGTDTVAVCQGFHGGKYAAGRLGPDGRHDEDDEQYHAAYVRVLLPDASCRYGHLLDHVRGCPYGADHPDQ